MTFSIDAAASALLAARRERRPIPADGPGPADAAAAFAVQDKVAESLGPTGAWKVGRSSPGGSFTAAPIAASLVRPSPCRWPAGELLRIGIEVEVAFRIGRDLPAAADPDTVRAAIASVHAAIEVVDSRFDTWPVRNPLWALADNQNSGGLVYDPGGRPFAADDLFGRAELSLACDGRTLFSGEGRNAGGNPFEFLLWLAGHVAARGGLPAGTLVTSGTLSGIDFVQPGARVRAEIAGLGRVEVAFPA